MRTDSATTELGTQCLLDAAERGADHLARSVLPEGRFAPPPDAPAELGSYDLTRHFGALWAMLDVRGYDPAVQEAGMRGVRWAVGEHYRRTPQGGAFGGPDRLLTGCSGLALAAMDELAPEHAHVAPAPLRVELVDFLLANQITGGPDLHDFPRRVEQRPFAIDLERAEVTVGGDDALPVGSSATSQILFGLTTYLAALADAREPGGGPDDQRFAVIYAAVGNAMAALMVRDHGVRRGPVWAMHAVRRFAELTDRMLAVTGQGDHELAWESRHDLLSWASRIAGGVLAARAEERATSGAPTARRVQTLVQFLELLDAYADDPGDQSWWAPAELARRQLVDDCGVLLRLQDPLTGGFRPAPDEPAPRLDETRHAISALLGAASVIGG